MIQRLPDRSFELIETDPRPPSLHFKPVGRFRSARVNLSYRALALPDGEDVVRFWIGTHTDHDRMVG